MSAARAATLVTQAQRDMIREISARAGALRKTPEQSLVAFKSVLHDAANDAGLPLGRERSNLFERFVSLFIEGLYTDGAARATVEPDFRRTAANLSIPAGNPDSPSAHP